MQPQRGIYHVLFLILMQEVHCSRKYENIIFFPCYSRIVFDQTNSKFVIDLSNYYFSGGRAAGVW
jgi:hypothetical protein